MGYLGTCYTPARPCRPGHLAAGRAVQCTNVPQMWSLGAPGNGERCRRLPKAGALLLSSHHLTRPYLCIHPGKLGMSSALAANTNSAGNSSFLPPYAATRYPSPRILTRPSSDIPRCKPSELTNRQRRSSTLDNIILHPLFVSQCPSRSSFGAVELRLSRGLYPQITTARFRKASDTRDLLTHAL